MTDELPPDAEYPINHRKAFAKREALITRLEGYANNCWVDNMKAEYKDLREVVYLLRISAPVSPADGAHWNRTYAFPDHDGAAHALPDPSQAVAMEPVPKDILYTVLSNHIPSEMIDSIWQELSEALKVKL